MSSWTKEQYKEYNKKWYNSKRIEICANRRENYKIDKVKRIQSTLKARKKIPGLIKETYRLMVRRVNGESTRCPEIYKGLPICTKEEFFNWANNNNKLQDIHKEWVDSDYNYYLKPSINRIESDKGYTLDNIEFITLIENLRYKKRNTCYIKARTEYQVFNYCEGI